MMARVGFAMAVLVVLAAVAFGPAVNSELVTVDDPGLIRSLETRTAWNLKRTFVRHHATGLYYRPLTGLSFTADKLLWDADLRAMHLVNILLHTLNALLVFFLARYLLGFQRYGWHLSLLSAVLFLCHPLVSESVNWLSGRTDILSATFVFGSALAMMQFRRSRRWFWLLGALCLAGLGLLAKETAIAFLAGLGFLLWARERSEKLVLKSIVRRAALLAGMIATAGTAAWALLFALRKSVLGGGTSHIATTLRVMDTDWGYSFFVCLRAFGFYVKKIFLPLPLNFAIVEVDPLYELLAVPALLLLAYLFMKRSMDGAYLLTGAALISPAFPIAFNQIAWTPYAERYVYLALGFVLPAVVFYARKIKVDARCVVSGLSIVVLLFLSITSHRSWQWRSNQTLWADTTQKSPLCEKALNNYGVALCRQGKYEEAQELFDRVARRKHSNFRYNDKYDVNVAVAMMRRRDYQKAREKLFYAIEYSKGVSSRAVDVYLEIAEKQPGSQKDHVIHALRDQLALWADKTGKAGYFYQLGRLEKHLNNQESACEYFTKAHAATREPDPMWAKAAKALEGCAACPRPK